MKFFYWGPYTGFVGTIQGMVNSAVATRRFGGHEVCLIRAYEEWKETGGDIADAGVQVIDLGLAKYLPGLHKRNGFWPSRLFTIFLTVFSPWRLARAIDREKPDVLITCLLAVPALLAVKLARHKPRVVSIIWGFPAFLLPRQKQPLHKRIEGRLRRFLWERLYRSADHIAAVSNGTKSLLEKEFPFARPKLFLLNAPIALPRLRKQAAEPCPHPWLQERTPGWILADSQMGEGCEHDGAVLLAVGRLSYQKGHDTLLAALALAQEQLPVRLIILGRGENEGALRAQALRLGVTVDFAGFSDNPFAFASRVDGFIISSRWEDLCHVIIEAAYVGAPIVTTDCPSGPGDFIRRGEAGELCSVDDAAGMAAAILRLLTSSDRGAAKARLACECAQAYTLEHHYTQLKEAIDRQSPETPHSSEPLC